MSLTRLAALLAAVAAATVLVFGVQAQESALRVDVVGVSEGAYPDAQAVVNIDGAGSDVGSLSAESFSVTVDGVPVDVTSAELASSDEMPLDVVLLIDVSGSMAGTPIASARDAAKAFVSGLAPDDRVAVMAFSDNVRLVQDFTTDRAAADAAIDGLDAVGGTWLYQATAEAAKLAGDSTATRRAVVLLSDGAHDGPTDVTRELAILTAVTEGVPFFTIAEGTEIDRDYLQHLADATNGRYLEAPVPSELGALYAEIGRLLRSQYVVTFDASSASRDGSVVGVTVSAGDATASDDAGFTPGPGFVPELTIAGITAGEQLTEPRTITVNGPPSLDSVTFYVDDEQVRTLDERPYTYTFEPSKHGEGAHALRVVATVGSAQVEQSIRFTATPPVSTGGELPLIPISAGAGAGVLIALTLFITLKRRKRGEDSAPGRIANWAKPVLPEAPEVEPEDRRIEPESIGEPLGILITRAGPLLGSEYHVGGSPVSIGSSYRCGVRIEDPDLAGEEARIWIRNGQLMFHRMTRLTTLVADGTVGGWKILDEGDTFEIGQHQFEFRLLPQESSAPADDVPNILRDRGDEAAADDSGISAEPRGRLFEMMPKNDLGTNPDQSA